MSFFTQDILCTRNYMRRGLITLPPYSRLILKAMLSGNRGKEMLFVNRRRTKRKGNLQVEAHFMTRLNDVSRVRYYVHYHNPATLPVTSTFTQLVLDSNTALHDFPQEEETGRV